MLYCDAATFCRRRNDAGIMTDETERRCAQESIDIIIMKNNYNLTKRRDKNDIKKRRFMQTF